MEKESIGSRIREARLKKGLTQKQLAEELGLTQGKVCRLEANDQGIVVSRVPKLCEVLKISADWLFGLAN